MASISRIINVHPSAALGATTNYPINGVNGEYNEMVAYLSVTAVSGTSPTLDIAFETLVNGIYYAHTTLTQATAATTERKVIPFPIGVDGRIVATIGGTSTPTVTFTLDLECKRT